MPAASRGASQVMGVDSSARAIHRARENARSNQLAERCRFHQADVLAFLKNLERASFDVIIVDPPAFAKSRKTLADAQKGYIDLNRRALLALAPGGMLVTCSCSYHLTRTCSERSFCRPLRPAAGHCGFWKSGDRRSTIRFCWPCLKPAISSAISWKCCNADAVDLRNARWLRPSPRRNPGPEQLQRLDSGLRRNDDRGTYSAFLHPLRVVA